MFCVYCGVKLADTEEKCPLCGTTVYHPDIRQSKAPALYPKDRIPKPVRSKGINGVILFLFLFPVVICLLADLLTNGHVEWFGYVAGALGIGYIFLALPLWFHRPNPVIFVPCGLASVILYLLYINFVTGGNWFLFFALPIAGCFSIILSALVTLLHYLHKGRLYIWGGGLMALGVFTLLIEYLLCITFSFVYSGWSFYPFISLLFGGGLLIYLAINRTARERMQRKLFF